MNLINLKSSLILLTILVLFSGTNAYSQKTREEIPDKYKWKLTDIFPTDEAWRIELNNITVKLNEVEKFKGTLTKSGSNLLKALQYNSELSKEAVKLYIYAAMNSDLDTRNMTYTGMKQELQQLFSNFGAKAAFMEPEILTAEWESIEVFIKKEPKLEDYRLSLENMFRTKKHTLSEPEERILALSGMISSIPSSVYGTFSDAEMPKPTVTLSNGEKIEIGSSEYSRFRASANRADREIVFKAYWDNFAKFKASYGEMLYGNVSTLR